MRIGITCNLQGQVELPEGAPDDLEEEFDKPATVHAIAQVLEELGHQVEILGDGPPLLRRLLENPPEFVFNFAEGTGASRSREARVPAALEMLGIPYSGSDPLTLAVTLDKDCAKRLVESAGVRAPRGLKVLPERAAQAGREAIVFYEQIEAAQLGFPLVVKPAYEGSSKGIRSSSLVDSAEELAAVLRRMASDYHQPVLVEQFIPGEEVTVGVLGNDPPSVIGMMHILPATPDRRFLYSLEVKRDWKARVRYQAPPELPPEIIRKLEHAALACYEALGCQDVCRIDFRLRDGEPYFLEANPLPGLNPESSDLVLLARGYGMEHSELVRGIFLAACRRLGWTPESKKPKEEIVD